MTGQEFFGTIWPRVTKDDLFMMVEEALKPSLPNVTRDLNYLINGLRVRYPTFPMPSDHPDAAFASHRTYVEADGVKKSTLRQVRIRQFNEAMRKEGLQAALMIGGDSLLFYPERLTFRNKGTDGLVMPFQQIGDEDQPRVMWRISNGRQWPVFLRPTEIKARYGNQLVLSNLQEWADVPKPRKGRPARVKRRMVMNDPLGHVHRKIGGK